MTPSGTLRTDPGFRRYLAARVVSTVGTLITAVVLPVLVYRLTGSAAWTAAVVVAGALPHLLLVPAATSIAARCNCRHLLFAADLVGGALLLSIPLAWWNDYLSAVHVLVVAGGVQAVFVLRALAHPAAVHALAGPELTDAVHTALRGATGLVELMVPPLAGLAVVIVAPAPLLTLDAVSFLASALLVRAALAGRTGAGAPPKPPTRRPPTRRPVRTGLWLLHNNRPARRLALAGTLHAAAGAAFLALLLPWADRHLGVPPSGDARLALLLSCWWLGAMGGYSLLPGLLRWLGPVRLVRTGLAVSLVCGLGAVLSTHWLPAVLIGLVWGAAHLVAASAALRSLGAPSRSAVLLLCRGLGPAAGATLAGALAIWSEPRAALVIPVALLTLATLVAPCLPFGAGSRSWNPRSRRSEPNRGPGRREGPGTLVDRAIHGDVGRDRPEPRSGIS